MFKNLLYVLEDKNLECKKNEIYITKKESSVKCKKIMSEILEAIIKEICLTKQMFLSLNKNKLNNKYILKQVERIEKEFTMVENAYNLIDLTVSSKYSYLHEFLLKCERNKQLPNKDTFIKYLEIIFSDQKLKNLEDTKDFNLRFLLLNFPKVPTDCQKASNKRKDTGNTMNDTSNTMNDTLSGKGSRLLPFTKYEEDKTVHSYNRNTPLPTIKQKPVLERSTQRGVLQYSSWDAVQHKGKVLQYLSNPVQHKSKGVQHKGKGVQHKGKGVQHKDEVMQYLSNPVQHKDEVLQYSSNPVQYKDEVLQYLSNPVQYISNPVQHKSNPSQHKSNPVQHIGKEPFVYHPVYKPQYTKGGEYRNTTIIGVDSDSNSQYKNINIILLSFSFFSFCIIFIALFIIIKITKKPEKQLCMPIKKAVPNHYEL